ncbi:HPP family-domain-containing protein [Hyaloraphidium curvatum]|nr:HPP family-domain-containing protein [Hyaloraphidium curvatum]
MSSPPPPRHPLFAGLIAPSHPLKDARDAFADPAAWWRHYWRKWLGSEIPSVGTPAPSATVLIFSFLGAFLGIFAVAMITYSAGVPAMIGSFGASAVLIFGTIESPLAQPRNLVFGHLLSAFWGVCTAHILEASGVPASETGWRRSLGCASAVAGALLLMQITRTTHPPGGATALIAASYPAPCSPQPCYVAWTYIVWPVGLGCAVLLLTALVVENLGGRRYPVYWWAPYRKPPAAAEAAPEKDGGAARVPGPVQPKDAEAVVVEDRTDEEMRARQLEQEAEVAAGEDVTPGIEFEELERELGSYGGGADGVEMRDVASGKA